MARKIPAINAGSMADIAFLLLIFFLVTTTMDVDTGIMRQLPPPPDPNQEIPDIKERNIMNILVSRSDRLLVNKKYYEYSGKQKRSFACK
jgi:biopolymer transport protein ExbD